MYTVYTGMMDTPGCAEIKTIILSVPELTGFAV